MGEKEPPENVKYMCPNHSKEAVPHAGLFDITDLAGAKFVKARFEVKDNPVIAAEHMWVKVESVSLEGTITGRLDNEPEYADLDYGQVVVLTIGDVEAVLK